MSHEEENDIPIFEDFEDNADFTSKKPADSKYQKLRFDLKEGTLYKHMNLSLQQHWRTLIIQ